jgi:hypothetical protein
MFFGALHPILEKLNELKCGNEGAFDFQDGHKPIIPRFRKSSKTS